MKRIISRGIRTTFILAGLLVIHWLPATPVSAQNPELQQRVVELKQSIAQNKQQLAQYTYVEQVTISLKGEQK